MAKDLKYLKVLNSSNEYDEYNLMPKFNKSQCVFYVDPVNGSDTNDGLTLSTAFKTIMHAVQECSPTALLNYEDAKYTSTHKIYLVEGTYSEYITVKGGLYITFIGLSQSTDSSTTGPQITIGTSDSGYSAVRAMLYGKIRFQSIYKLTLNGTYGLNASSKGEIFIETSILNVITNIYNNNVGAVAATGGYINFTSPTFRVNIRSYSGSSNGTYIFSAKDINSSMNLSGVTPYVVHSLTVLPEIYFIFAAWGATIYAASCVLDPGYCYLSKVTSTAQRSFWARGAIIHWYNCTYTGSSIPRVADRGGYIFSGSQSF